jgi:ATP-dependent Clp protease protease subunit
MSQTPNSWYAVNAKAGDAEAEVMIYDAIGAWGITADKLVRDIKAIDASRINVRLNTPGGEVFDGTAIHNALKSHPARVIVHIDGLAASAGSFIALAGDEIRMAATPT